MSEILLDRPPEAMPHPESAEISLQRDFDRYGPTEKAVADIALTGASLNEAQESGQFGEQLSMEDELSGYKSWPVTDAEKGIVASIVPESNYTHPEDMSPLEEAKYTVGYIEHTKAHDEWKSGKIGWDEFHGRIADKTPRTYQQPLLRQEGQVFEQEKPAIDQDPNKGVGAADGTFWHASDHLMEPGDRVLPSGEVPDVVHEANKLNRRFHSESSPISMASNYDSGGEKDFAFGEPRESGVLPTPYGNNLYKVSSPNSKIVAVTGGKEVWAEGGARIEKRMHPDFASNYAEARSRVNADPFQAGLPGMENGLQFVPESELDVSANEFHKKHPIEQGGGKDSIASVPGNHPEDIALPGFEEHGKLPDNPVIDSTGNVPMM